MGVMTDLRALLARTADKVLADVGWDVERDGLAGGPAIRVVARTCVTEESPETSAQCPLMADMPAIVRLQDRRHCASIQLAYCRRASGERKRRSPTMSGGPYGIDARAHKVGLRVSTRGAHISQL